MKKISFNPNSIQKIIPTILRMGAERIFISFIFLFLFALMITTVVWYLSLRLDKAVSHKPEPPFRNDTLFEIIDIRERRIQEIQALSSKEYGDVFSSEKQ